MQSKREKKTGWGWYDRQSENTQGTVACTLLVAMACLVLWATGNEDLIYRVYNGFMGVFLYLYGDILVAFLEGLMS